MKLICEISYDINSINEKKDEKNLYVVGIFSSAEVKNANGRVYPRQILEREIEKFYNEKVKQKCAIGQLNHPNTPEGDLEKAAILVEDLEWKSNNVMGRAKVLTTPSGQIVRNLINDGVKIGISSRGLGDVSESGIVEDTFNLLTYDIVSNPSNIGSWINGIYEGNTFGIDKDKEKQIKEAKEEYKKKIWQVLENIEKNI
jgi:hypothetical protein